MVFRGRQWLRPVARAVAGRFRRARWAVVQTAGAVSASWFIAHDLLGHPQPFFAPIAAAVSLSASNVLRGQRAVQLMSGVALGIALGTVVEAVAGTGAPAFAVAALLAMYGALAFGGGPFGQGLMFVNQTAASAILILALHRPGSGSERLVDALIGGGVVVVIGVVLFPADPHRVLDQAARAVFAALRDALAELRDQLADETPAGRRDDGGRELAIGQRIHNRLAALEQARGTAQQVVLIAPRRWRSRAAVHRAIARSKYLTLQANAVLSLVRVARAALGSGEELPRPLLDAVAELTDACATLAAGGRPAAAGAAAERARDLLDPAKQAGPGYRGPAIYAARACARDLLAAIDRTGDDRVPAS
ncbi:MULTISPECIES: FUSC family protein [Amycolatopsis]|uniref:FUSC family protein n=1 Tax=Amycolatopsis bullii TaxID=941987 RepID=A0ABQ3KSV4_9PSEU|nr:FUSC family protein [Amycolatopsis bullii]GHG50776.1 FUSC family protein [Amycolatopsis bullii]